MRKYLSNEEKHLVTLQPEATRFFSHFELHYWAQDSKWDEVKHAVIHVPSFVNNTNYQNKTLLEFAILQGNEEAILFLLEYGAFQSVSVSNKDSSQTLHDLLEEKFAKKKEEFFFKVKKYFRIELISKSIEKGDENQVVKYLKEDPSVINFISPRTSNSFLHEAVEKNQVNIVKSLLQFDLIDITLRNGDIKTALQIATWNNFTEIKDLLLQFQETKKKELQNSFQPSNPTLDKLFKDITLYRPDLSEKVESLSLSPKRIDLFKSQLGKSCFFIERIMSSHECKHYIEETEKVGYSNLVNEYPTSYRSNERVLVYNKELAKDLWSRISPYLEFKDVVRLHPLDFGNEGTWRPVGLNACFKFGRYKKGGFFSPHIDGPWIPSWDLASAYTVIIYLNDDFEGGETELLEADGFFDDHVSVISPKAGNVFIFRHDFLHAASPIISGTKYIIRTEIMFQRVDENMIVNPYKYETDPNYVKAKALYEKAEDYEQESKPTEFTETYLQALALQKQALNNYSSSSELNFQILPLDILRFIFSFCSGADVSRCMRVSKAWYDIARDGWIWKQLFSQKWPGIVNLEDKLLPNVNPSIRDWYTIYKHRYLLNSSLLRTVVIDEYGDVLKYGIVDYGLNYQIMLPLPIPHTLWKTSDRVSHIRMKYIFRLSQSNYGIPLPFNSTNRHFYWHIIFQRLGVHSDRHPILISVSPFVHEKQLYKEGILETANLYFHSPAICFVDSPILSLYAVSSQTSYVFPAIVITICHEGTAITPVSDQKCLFHFLVTHPSYSIILENVQKAAQLLDKEVENCLIVLSSTENTDLIGYADSLKQYHKNLNIVANLENQKNSNIVGGINFATLSSFPKLFEKTRIVDLSNN